MDTFDLRPRVVQNAGFRAALPGRQAKKCRYRQGRQQPGNTLSEYPKPFYRKQTGTWYVQIGTLPVNLGPDKDKATAKYHTLMAGKQGADDGRFSVAILATLFGTPNQEHRRLDTQEPCDVPILSYVEHVGLRVPVFDVEQRTLFYRKIASVTPGSPPDSRRKSRSNKSLAHSFLDAPCANIIGTPKSIAPMAIWLHSRSRTIHLGCFAGPW